MTDENLSSIRFLKEKEDLTSIIYNKFMSIKKVIMETITDKNEVYLIFINIILFMIIQTIFFKFAISTEYEHLIEEKIGTLNYYITQDPVIKNVIKEMKDEETKKYKEKAEEDRIIREKENDTLYLYYCIIPILCVVFLFIVIIILDYFSLIFKNEKKLGYIHYFNFALILLIYIPNIIVFYYVVKKYQFLGNIEILSSVYNNIINKEK
jgi:hypothetical protein